MEGGTLSTSSAGQQAAAGASGGGVGLCFEALIQCQHGAPRRGEVGAAAAGSAATGGHEGLRKAGIHGLDERPGAHVGHVHARRGVGDAVAFLEVPEQIDLAWTQGDVRAPDDAQARLKFGLRARWAFAGHGRRIIEGIARGIKSRRGDTSL